MHLVPVPVPVPPHDWLLHRSDCVVEAEMPGSNSEAGQKVGQKGHEKEAG